MAKRLDLHGAEMPLAGHEKERTMASALGSGCFLCDRRALPDTDTCVVCNMALREESRKAVTNAELVRWVAARVWAAARKLLGPRPKPKKPKKPKRLAPGSPARDANVRPVQRMRER